MKINLPNIDDYHTVEEYLKNKERELEKQLHSIKRDDPILAELMLESIEAGTESWEADVHAKSTAMINILNDLSKKVKISLGKLQKGTYGICDKCGQHIEQERLEAIPIATLCTICVHSIRI